MKKRQGKLRRVKEGRRGVENDEGTSSGEERRREAEEAERN